MSANWQANRNKQRIKRLGGGLQNTSVDSAGARRYEHKLKVVNLTQMP